MDLFLQQIINGLALGGIYALIALGYTMIYGIIELINFAHGDVYTLGTFFSLAILTLLGVTGIVTGPMLIVVVVVTMLGAMKSASAVRGSRPIFGAPGISARPTPAAASIVG